MFHGIQCRMPYGDAFHDLVLAASGTSFLWLNLCLHLEARHTLQDVEVPSHTSLRHLCPVMIPCPSDDAKVKSICSNKASNIYIFTLVETYQPILYICYRC